MSLPITANRTLANDQRVSRADILSIQDCQVARYQRGLSLKWSRTTSAIRARPGTSPSHWPTSATMYREAAAGGQTLIFPVTLPALTRVFQLSARIFGGGGATLALGLYRRQHGSSTAAAAVTSFTTTGASSGTWSTLATGAITFGHILEPGWRYFVRLTSGQGADACLWSRLLADRP